MNTSDGNKMSVELYSTITQHRGKLRSYSFTGLCQWKLELRRKPILQIFTLCFWRDPIYVFVNEDDIPSVIGLRFTVAWNLPGAWVIVWKQSQNIALQSCWILLVDWYLLIRHLKKSKWHRSWLVLAIRNLLSRKKGVFAWIDGFFKDQSGSV